MFSVKTKSALNKILTRLALESVMERLTESRNRAPAIGGTYGTYGFTRGGWTR